MSRAREIATTLVLVVVWVAIVVALIVALTGCEALQKQDKREGRLVVEADCVRVEFSLDQHGEDHKVELRK